MKVAIVGSRKINEVDIAPHLPAETDGIISGGAIGVDTAARVFATNDAYAGRYSHDSKSANSDLSVRILFLFINMSFLIDIRGKCGII